MNTKYEEILWAGIDRIQAETGSPATAADVAEYLDTQHPEITLSLGGAYDATQPGDSYGVYLDQWIVLGNR